MTSLPPPPEELKFVNPYLQRAQETRKREPVISYYCNYYAAKLALEKKSKSKENTAFITKLLDTLERDKKELADNEAVSNDVSGELYVTDFALKVFAIADNEDRACKATRTTAKTFAAASTYMELLKIFGEISPDIENKIKYAKWKTIDILKALKEGRTPVPGPPGGEPALQQPESEENNQSVASNVDQFPSAPTSSSSVRSTGPPTSSDNDPLQLFPSAPSNSNSVPNVQDLVSSFEQIDIKPSAPPLPPKVNDDIGNNNNIFDNQFNQQPPTSTFSPPPSNNLYDIHNNNLQFPPTQPPSSLIHTSFTNDYTQPHHQHQQQYQQQPQQPPQLPQQQPQPPPSFIVHPQAPPQNYIQPINPPPHQQLSFSTTVSSHHHQYGYSRPTPAEIDPTIITTVQKYCKFANSALDYNDVKTAVDYMHKALEALEPYNQ